MLTPLIDVVYLLLIFFLLTSTFDAGDPFPLEPPAAQAGPPETSRALTVGVAADGRVAVNGHIVSAAGLESALREPPQRGSVESLTVRADRAAPSGIILRVLETAQRAGWSPVRLLTVWDDAPGSQPHER